MKVKKTSSDRIFDIFNYAFIIFITLCVAYPLYFVIIASFSDPTCIANGEVLLLPKGFTLEGYVNTLKNEDVWLGYRNTIFYTLVGTTINISITLAAGYAMSRKDLKGRNIIMLFFAITMFFKGGMIPSYLLMKDLHILDTVWVMLLPGALSVWNMIIARTYFQTNLPDELLEASKVDGCSDFKFFFRIALPLAKAITAVLILYYAVGHWNSYFNALIYLSDRSKFPLQIFLREILIQSDLTLELMQNSNAQNAIDNTETMRYVVIIVSSIPALVMYQFVQKHFMKGVMVGAIKG